MEYASLMVLAALIQYAILTGKVGAARGKFGVKAPSCTGNEMFERALRVQQNTLEQLIIFIPGCFLFAHYVHPRWVLVPGMVFLIARGLFANAYVKDPSNRGLGMTLTLLANVTLLLLPVIFVGMELI